jgi:predicted DNA-binding protein (MmcQ/YjbR family)
LTRDEYNRFCRSLPATTHVVQWGGAHVWKVGARVFAIARENEDDSALHVTFKCSPMSYDMLREMAGCRPAPYLASRGMLWIQRTSDDALDDRGLKDYLRASYDLVIVGLSKRVRQEIGLAGDTKDVKSQSSAERNTTRASAAATITQTTTTSPTKSAAKAGRKPRAMPARAQTRKGVTA